MLAEPGAVQWMRQVALLMLLLMLLLRMLVLVLRMQYDALLVHRTHGAERGRPHLLEPVDLHGAVVHALHPLLLLLLHLILLL